MKDLTTLAAAVALLDQPGLLEMSAVFQPLVVNQETFVRSENGTFGLRLVRPETGEEVVLDFRDLAALHEELVRARAEAANFACSECGWHHAVDCQHKADLAASRARTCATCAYGNRDADLEHGVWAESGINCRVLGGHILPCRVFNFTCGAWAAKEPRA